MGRRFVGPDGNFKPGKELPAIISTAVTLLMLHVVEVVVWAVAYRVLDPISSLDTFEKAMYFSVVTFTTLGYGDITLPEQEWRMLSGIEALNGILLVGLDHGLSVRGGPAKLVGMRRGDMAEIDRGWFADHSQPLKFGFFPSRPTDGIDTRDQPWPPISNPEGGSCLQH